MTWAIIPGSPHGGIPSSPGITSISHERAYIGDVITLTGTNFTPGSQVLLLPGDILAGISMPTITTSIDFEIPSGIPNIKYSLYVSNGTNSNAVELFVEEDRTIENPSGEVNAEVTLGEFN